MINDCIERISALFWHRRADVFLTIRQYPLINATTKANRQLQHCQLKLATFMMGKKYKDILKSSFIAMHAYNEEIGLRQDAAARQIVAFSRLRKQDTLRVWLNVARTSKRRQAEEAKV